MSPSGGAPGSLEPYKSTRMRKSQPDASSIGRLSIRGRRWAIGRLVEVRLEPLGSSTRGEYRGPLLMALVQE